jgi:hypothetical protein
MLSEERQEDFRGEVMQSECDELKECAVSDENITMELPAQVLTMGSEARNFATVNNSVQKISNGDTFVSETVEEYLEEGSYGFFVWIAVGKGNSVDVVLIS